MGTTLVVNPGSSSRKYAVFCDGSLGLDIRYENTPSGYELSLTESGKPSKVSSVTKQEFDNSFKEAAEEADRYLFRQSAGALQYVVIRVVAPGTYFQKHQIINDEFVKNLKAKEEVAPLHVPSILREIAQAQKYCKTATLIAASDSAFHATIPKVAREFSIPAKEAEEFDLYRFGYHGLSVASIGRRIHSLVGIDPENMIVAHIGSGSSVTAVKKGKSIDTTMGFSPCSGFLMGSRAGDLDSDALVEVMRLKNLRHRDAEVYLNTAGGLVGMAGDADIRKLLDRKAQNDEKAIAALDKYAYSIRQAIAKSIAALQDLDVLVLTATAAVRSSELRLMILQGLECFGIKVSKDRNDAVIGKDGVISLRNSPVKIVVMRTDEVGEMAAVTNQFKK